MSNHLTTKEFICIDKPNKEEYLIETENHARHNLETRLFRRLKFHVNVENHKHVL